MNKQFEKCNIERNAELKTYGVFGKSDYIPRNTIYNKLKVIEYNLNILLELIQHKIFQKVNIPFIEFLITTKCTLKCKKCSNLIPYFNKDSHFEIDFENFCRDLDSLLLGVNNIKHFELIGGEPFIHKDVGKMLEYANSKKQIKNIYIVTNSTIIPNEDILVSMKKCNKKLTVMISDYSANLAIKERLKISELKALLNKNHIKFISRNDFHWYDMGGVEFKNRPMQKNIALYQACNCFCNAIFKGKLHVCPRSANILGLGDYKIDKSDYVELRRFRTSNSAKLDLLNFYSNLHTSPCQYCNSFAERIEVMPAEQITKEALNDR